MSKTTLYERVLLCLFLLTTLAFGAPASQFIDDSGTVTFAQALDNTTEPEITKRASTLYDLWQSVPNANKVTGSNAIYHKWDRSQNQAYGVTYLYGCTAILISDPTFMIVAHLAEEGVDSNNVPKCQLGTPSAVRGFINGPLLSATSQMEATVNTRVSVIYGANQPGNPTEGLRLIREHLFDSFEIKAQGDYTQLSYFGSSGTGEPIAGNPTGLAVIQWVTARPGPDGAGNIRVYYDSDTPIRDDSYAA